MVSARGKDICQLIVGYAEILVLGLLRTEQITGSAFRISFQPGW